MRYSRHPKDDLTSWDIEVDGNGYRIAAWSQQLARELPVIAEGDSGPRAGARARSIASSLVARWTELCVGNDEATDRVTDTGRDEQSWFWPVIDLPNAADTMYPRLVLADELIGRWIVHDLPEEVAIEEMHTAVEALLRRLLNTKRATKWPVLLRTATTAGVLSSDDRTLLIRFANAHRNRLKHEARALTDMERIAVQDLLSDVLAVTERLLDHHRRLSAA